MGRSLKRRKRRGNSRFIIYFLLISALVIFAVRGGHYLLRHVSWFNITSIVVTGNINLDEESLKELAAEFIGTNLYSVPLKTVEYKYENIIRISDIKIRRVFPNRLKLIVEERIGFVYVKTNEGILIPVDEYGIVLDRRYSFLSENLPIICADISKKDLIPGNGTDNEVIQQAIEIHKTVIESNINENDVSEYYLSNGNFYLIELNSGSRICLGKENYREKLYKLEFIMDNIGIEKQSILDLRFEDQVVIRNR